MGDGKALQMATSHELGQNFATAFDIKYLGDDGVEHLCWTTSWGASTRLVGGLIMGHGDDNGLLLPPRIAPDQVVVLTVRDEDVVNDAAEAIHQRLLAAGVRTNLDRRAGSFGRRVTEWEIKGVPVRIEVGPRDLAEGKVTLARRDTGEKVTVALEDAAATANDLLEVIQTGLLTRALERREAKTSDVTSLDEAMEAGAVGFARLPWSAVGPEGEAALNAKTLSVRCLQRSDGSIPDSGDEDDLIAIVARSY